jgi:hypothetical protein
MAFPWITFEKADLATGNMVEDLHLALQLAHQGIAVRLVESAKVLSPSAAAADTLAQRRRWEHGFLETAGRRAIPLLCGGIVRASRQQIALALDLLVPPLALLMALALMCGAVLAVFGALSGTGAPAVVLFSALAVALANTLVAWFLYGRDVLAPAALATAPLYIIRKIPLYVGFILTRQMTWNRTPRQGEGD